MDLQKVHNGERNAFNVIKMISNLNLYSTKNLTKHGNKIMILPEMFGLKIFFSEYLKEKKKMTGRSALSKHGSGKTMTSRKERCFLRSYRESPR